MYKRILILLCVAIFLPLKTLANNDNTQAFVEGKQYKTITASTTIATAFQIPQNKILVVEFFSYGCPWCFHLEPTLEKWLKNKPDYIEFERVPVIFESGWQNYAKAYYVAKALGKLDQITPNLFNAIHKQHLDLTNNDAMEKFFISQGVNKKDFNSAFNFSPGINLELQRANNLMLAYKIFEIPTFIINGKYLTTAAMNKGNDQELMQVVDYLIKKEHA